MPGRLPIAFGALVLVICASAWASAELADDTSNSTAIRVDFGSGETQLATLQEGVQYFTNHPWTLQSLPSEILSLPFTRRAGGKPTNVQIEVPNSGTVYLLVDSENGPNNAAELNRRLASSGWTRIQGDASYTARGTKKCAIAVYKMDVMAPRKIDLKGAQWAGFVVAANSLAVGRQSTGNGSGEPEVSSSPMPEVSQVTLTGNGPTTRITKLQSSIETLYVVEQPSGAMLGSTMHLILTASPGNRDHDDGVPISFATPVGHDMRIVLEEVARAIDVHYRLGGLKKIELSFEDKYDVKDGGSIGAAIGTLMLSIINGFDIDPKVAITGDVSADSKVLRIGSVAAKLRGAADGGCDIVALPADNLDQVTDALVYEGPGILTNLQVFGISNLEDAQAVCRSDRAADMTNAIKLFRDIQKSLQNSRDYLYSPDAQEKLHQVLALAPNHFSAKLLIVASEHKLPRLTAAASEYYTFVAVREYLAAPTVEQVSARTTSASTQIALGKLRKLRPVSDLTVVPYIDAWSDYIQAIEDYRNRSVSLEFVKDKSQEVANEGTKLETNRDLAENLLREGN